MWQRLALIRQFKLNFIRLLRARGTADEIAKGLALGVFIGMTPTFGVQMIIAVFVAILLRENKIAAAAGVWVTNPFTAPFIYALGYETGRLLLGMDRVALVREFNYEAVKRFGWDLFLPLTVGGIVLGVLCGVITYALTVRAIPVVKTWRVPRWPRPRRRKDK
ncbi:hypothetical protein SAMN05660860_02958 [Geoalkalibacter ferrihydriticus]|uniref:DUF2062 domain-containing protein n=2 Tax=Geoalkalibacter ferrihydriticus TaxID=392333 RepID=A0A0C2HSR5_9BACT|nr:DUF2062 domain-containing protein [Geoalkalibacter ferrihydriticus]KIH75817.1 hypothetical protein GFER_14595 [Geoalkalibacter ferrihydriticus DSM 17813]SDM66346.1 hypothetical protein SAMN05660860_02958 [Geoalkalibacter ferrihydriticus]